MDDSCGTKEEAKQEGGSTEDWSCKRKIKNMQNGIVVDDEEVRGN